MVYAVVCGAHILLHGRTDRLLIHFNSIVSLCVSLIEQKPLSNTQIHSNSKCHTSAGEYFEFVVRFLAHAIIIAAVVIRLAGSHPFRSLEAMAEKGTIHFSFNVAHSAITVYIF